MYYLKLYYKLLDWEWYTNANVMRIFIHCLLKANVKTKKWQGITIKRGSFITSYENLAFETGLTVRQVRTALDKLKTTGELTCKSTSRCSIITVNNWNEYQPNDKQDSKQMTNKCQTNDKQMTTTKECKNVYSEKNERNIDIFCNQDFEKIFQIYSEACTNLIPLGFERRNRKVLEELSNFLIEIDYDFSYFSDLCKKANRLEKIVDSRIDFKMLINNHIGIMNGKYETKTSTALDKKYSAIDDFFAKKREVTNG